MKTLIFALIYATFSVFSAFADESVPVQPKVELPVGLVVYVAEDLFKCLPDSANVVCLTETEMGNREEKLTKLGAVASIAEIKINASKPVNAPEEDHSMAKAAGSLFVSLVSIVGGPVTQIAGKAINAVINKDRRSTEQDAAQPVHILYQIKTVDGQSSMYICEDSTASACRAEFIEALKNRPLNIPAT
jgi:hypothetical protein